MKNIYIIYLLLFFLFSNNLKGQNTNSQNYLFPIYGVTLSKTSVRDVKQLGYELADKNTNSYIKDGLWIWDDNRDGIFEKIYMVGWSDNIPAKWKDNFGFKWSNSYNEWIVIFEELEFSIKMIKNNKIKIYSGRKTLSGNFEATSKTGKTIFTLDFNYGNDNGEGYNINSKNSLYSITIKTKGVEIISNNNVITEHDKIPPEIIITYPNVSRGFKPVEQNKQITIQGNAKDASGIFEILVNGQEAYIDAQGDFTKNVLLAVGDNSFTITATDLKQNTSTKTFTIERKIQQQETVIVNNQTNNNVLQTGKYYALIIGNNSYQDNAIISLDEPINDAIKLYNVLTTQYTFDPQNITLLKNATYVQMIEAFDNLSNTLTENDNLLVFYAGHGWWVDDKNLGYWLPTDARKNSTAFWIANSRISDYMSSIKSKHTLLVADACFSGSIFKTRSAFNDAQPAINKLYVLPSKTAMTSGNLKEVPDKSVFLQYLVKRLNDNTEKYISADMLFASFRIAVMNNSSTEPQFGTIQNAGDEGGEFIFIRK